MTTALAIIYGLGLLATSSAFWLMFRRNFSELLEETGWFAVVFLAACSVLWPLFWIVAVVIVWLDGDEE